MKKVRLLICVLSLVTATSCEKWDLAGAFFPESEGVGERFSKSMEYNNANGFQCVDSESDEYRVYVFTDFHTDRTTHNLDAFVNTAVSDEACVPVSLYLGDMVNRRGEEPRDLFFNAVSALAQRCRLFMTPGNHDLQFGEWLGLLSRMHTFSYWFEVKCPNAKDLYICLDSASGTLGYDQRMWLESILKEKSEQYRNITVFTHTHFFKRDNSQRYSGNYPLEETYAITALFSKYGVDLVLTGHDHSMEDTMFGGVRYVTVQALGDDSPNPGYCICDAGDGIEVEFRQIP